MPVSKKIAQFTFAFVQLLMLWHNAELIDEHDPHVRLEQYDHTADLFKSVIIQLKKRSKNKCPQGEEEGKGKNL